MFQPAIALFGEAEKGSFGTPHICTSVAQLADCLGNPPDNSRGIDYAIQALYYNYLLIYFRVREEGFSEPDYFCGANLLKSMTIPSQALAAICSPGVGSHSIFDLLIPICSSHHSILITNQSDFYDYLTYPSEPPG